MQELSTKATGDKLTALEWDSRAKEEENLLLKTRTSFSSDTDGLFKSVEKMAKANMYRATSTNGKNYTIDSRIQIIDEIQIPFNGMRINVIPSQSNIDEILITWFNGTTYPLEMTNGDKVDVGDFQKGKVYNVLFNGTAFTLLEVSLSADTRNKMFNGFEGLNYFVDVDSKINNFKWGINLEMYDLSKETQQPPSADVANSEGYFNAVFDGSNVWFAPLKTGTKLAIVNTKREQTSYMDLEAINADYWGFKGLCFTGRHIVLSPSKQSIAVIIDILTRNVTGIDIASGGTVGFTGNVSDGNKVYFAPSCDRASDGTISDGKLMAILDMSTMSVSHVDVSGGDNGQRSFRMATMHNEYVFLSPFALEDRTAHGKLVRYNTLLGQIDSFDSAVGNPNARAFSGCVSDGRYIYLSPNGNDSKHGIMAIFDTILEEYDYFDFATINPLAIGYKGVLFDGRYIYLMPYANDTTVRHGLLAIYDIVEKRGEVHDLMELHPQAGGYVGGAFDGSSIWLSPTYDGVGWGHFVAKFTALQARKNITI